MQGQPSRGVTVAVASGALVVAAAGAALAAVGAHQLSDRDHVASLREQALSAGRQLAVDFAAYDYRHLDQDFRRVVRESTGSFRKQYQSSAAGVQDLITKAKAVSTAEVDGAGLVEASDASATVVVAVTRTVKNTSVPKGQTDSFGLQIVLRHVGDRWLATQVTPL